MTEHSMPATPRSRRARGRSLRAAAGRASRPRCAAPAYAERLQRHRSGARSRTAQALSQLPVLRKAELPALQKAAPPFGGFVAAPLVRLRAPVHLAGADLRAGGHRGRSLGRRARALTPWASAAGDVVLNTFSYHLTPGGFIMDSGARALGCAVIPAGPGQHRAAVRGHRGLPPGRLLRHAGLPQDPARRRRGGRPRRVLDQEGARAPARPSRSRCRRRSRARGIDAYQAYATADVGVIAYETSAREGMVVNEDLIVEIVRPGTGDPVPEGEVGEIVVTNLDPHHPQIRLALGDLTAALPGREPVRAHQHAHQGLDGPRRPDHQGQGHVRAARAGRGDRHGAIPSSASCASSSPARARPTR